MQVLTTIQDTKNYLSPLRKKGKTIGFVPTMGALHPGHISLLKRAKQENNISVSSIFVNPLQFNDKKDLENYPRTIDRDIEILNSVHCDVLFAPSAEEMYKSPPTPRRGEPVLANFPPSGELKGALAFDLGILDKVMEGKHRPGHFKGVCAVVKKLFDIVEPDKAYFGEKDFQQLAVIKHMVKTLNLTVEIISCPTVREADGLAMSSRNALLTSDERKNAGHIYKTLCEAREKWKVGRMEEWKNGRMENPHHSITELKKFVEEKINANLFLKLEYFEVVNSETLMPVQSLDETKNLRACIAVKAGKVRLIDNISR